MPIISTTKMTAEQFLQLGDDPPGVRLELVDGEVVTRPPPWPDHLYATMRLGCVLCGYVDEKQLGEMFIGVNTMLNDFNVRRPDLSFVPAERMNLVGELAVEGPPDVAIEIISPGSVAIDREDKFEQYQSAGVMNYWIVDPAERTIEAWTLREGRYVEAGKGGGSDRLTLSPFDGLVIDLAELWRKPWA